MKNITKKIFGTCFLSGAIITVITDRIMQRKNKQLEEELKKKRSEQLQNNLKESEKFFSDFSDFLKKETDKAVMQNTRRLVLLLYAVIKQRKTLMKSEEEFLLRMIRHNKAVKGIDLDTCSDQELLRFLETKCKFEIKTMKEVDGRNYRIPVLVSEDNTIAKFSSLEELEIDSI